MQPQFAQLGFRGERLLPALCLGKTVRCKQLCIGLMPLSKRLDYKFGLHWTLRTAVKIWSDQLTDCALRREQSTGAFSPDPCACMSSSCK